MARSLDRAKAYCEDVLSGKTEAPKYVKKQCAGFLEVLEDGTSYTIDEKRVSVIDKLTQLMIMPKGLSAGKTLYEVTTDFQWFFYVAPLCVVHKADKHRRRYESVLLEIARKNAKTFMIAVIFILLFFLEPKFSKFYSVAPDGKLSKEVHEAIKEIIRSSPAIGGRRFKLKRDEIVCTVTDNVYIPLNYSNDRLDGKLPSVFLVDEAGALPNSYAIEAMRSGQLTILNKLGCVISTKYPREDNPFESEIEYAKRVLDGIETDDSLFALLYEPNDTKGWETDDRILKHANPLSIDIPEIFEDLLKKRKRAVSVKSARENFLCKHCNILYQGIGTESYIAVEDLKAGRVPFIDWRGREAFLGLDLALTEDNCAAVWVSESEDGGLDIYATGYIPEDRINEKSLAEKVDYVSMIESGCCHACGDRIISYGYIEEHVRRVARENGFIVPGFGFDRYNCISTADRLENPVNGDEPWQGTIVEQKSYVLHPAVKYVSELAAQGRLHYTENRMLEINFANARCTYDSNLNRYVSKKKSAGKIDMVAALLNAVFVYLQHKQSEGASWGAQF
ncbi:MAG: terminase [Christensenellaceae bacterium]|nr:terminase [Christensenellaceae bacterium]